MKQNLFFNQASAIGKRIAMVLTMLLIVGIGQAWGEEIYSNTGESGTTNNITASGNINNNNGNPKPSFGLTSASKKEITISNLDLSNYEDITLTLDFQLAKSGNSYSSLTVTQYNSNNTSVGSQNITGSNNTSYKTTTVTLEPTCTQVTIVCNPAGSVYATYVDNIKITGTLAASGSEGECGWIETDISNISSTDDVIVTMHHGESIYALNSSNGTSAAPLATSITSKDFEQKIIGENILWNIEKTLDGKLIFHPKGTNKNLYCNASNSNDRVRIGTSGNALTNHQFTIDGNYLKFSNDTKTYYIGVYISGNPPDWRGYTSTTGNIANQTLKFYKYVECTTEPTPSLTALESNLSFGEVTINSPQQLTFTLSGSDLTANATLAISGTNKEMFSVSPTSVTPTDGSITDQTITVTYTPTAKASHSATLTISSTDADDVTVSLSGTGVAQTAEYNVKHYKQNLDGTYPTTPTDTDPLSGEVGASVTPAVKTYEGFTAPSTQTVTIASDGTTVVVYQYTRNSYTLTWNVNGGNALTGDYTSGSVKYEATITKPTDPTREGYRFSGWHDGTAIVTPATTMPANNLTYTAQWTKLHTITWKVNGEEYTEGTPTISVEDGNAITHLPTAPSAPSGCSEKEFVGWSETNLGMELGQSAPTDLFTTAPTTLITEPKIYHAVFADVESGGVIPTLPTAIAYWEKQKITENIGIPATSGTGTMTSNVSLSSSANRTYQSTISKNATITLSGLNLTSYDDITLTFWARGSANGDITITTDLSNEVISTVTLTGTEVLYKINNIPSTATSITLTYSANSGSFFFGTVKLMETETTTYSFTKLTSENTNGWTGQDWNGYYLITNSQPDPDLKALDGNAIGEKLYQSVTDNDGVIQSIISSAFLVSYNSTENGYSVKGVGENKYLGTANNSVSVSSDAVYHQTISYNALENTPTSILSWNNSGTKFGFYTGKQTSDPQLYKIMGGRYSNYVTLCDANKATITYDLNGGTGETCAKTTVTKGEEFALCNQTPTKTGYEFAGWTDGVNTYAADEKVTVNESTTFYAKWTAKTITITWDQNYTDCPEAATSTYIYDGEEIAMPAEPIRTGYKFTGWFDAATDGTQVTEVGETNKPTTDVTYYAHWAELYTVTFMASGQVYVVQEHKYLSGETLELPADPSAANYACDGYIFEGWSADEKTEDATKPGLISNPTITNDETYYAVWKKATTEGAGETIFYESFNDNDAAGGNDGNFNTASNTEECYVDNNGWEGNKFYEADQCIKLGGGSAKGYITTPALSQLGGNATLSFKAAAWNGSSESTTLVLSIAGGGSLSKNSVTLTKGAWQSYEVAITGGTSSTRITFAGKNTSNSRFFLDEVKVTTSGSYNYTTSPSCGPTIVAKDGMWVTSANGQSVKVNVPIAIKSFATNATITGTTANTNFAVTTLENTGNGEHNLVVTYTPNASNIKEDATITLTAKVGEETISTTTFTINGRSLPDEFAIVVDKASEYFALPANMPSAGTYPGYSVTLNAGSVTSAPKTHLYTAQAVHSTRFAENGTALRLVGNNNACLWATNAVSGTDIRNYAQLDNAKTADYEWNLYTEDGDTYRISCSIVTEEGRILRMYGANFGMYKSGAEVFYLLPVECTSTPTNIQVSPARVSATISWTNADACNVEVYNGSTKEQTISAVTSPVVVSNLAESTAYTFTLTPADNESCVASGAFTTTGPTIDIVEWETNGILIQVDKDNELNPKVVIKGEEEYGNVGGNVADELFFSKYFEAHAENKLLAIFNGTTATIDLTGYTIKSDNGTLDLSQFGQTKGQVAPNEEIILVYFDANYSAERCAETQQGYENWNILTDKSVLAFSGRGSLGLYKNDVLIDVIGSTFPSGELTKIGKSGSPDNCGTDETVRLHIDDVSVNDQSSFFCYNGDNIKTDEEENDYAISTNRCLLIRKNTVTSGANAVASNKAAAGATCGDLSSTFTTLCSEWSGFRIGSGKSSSDEIKDATCDGLGYVGGFDYNNYYRTLETLDNSKTLNDYTRNADENTYFIEIEDLAQYSCLNIQLQLTDNEGNVLTEQTSQVPILVAGEKSTTDEIFSAIVKDSETSEPDYETSKIRCSTCDVVILENATLTKAAVETVNDVNQVRDIYIYPGGKLVVPANATDYSVNNVSLRRVQDEVAAADIQAPLNITSSSKAPIFVDVRIDANNWHWFALPYDCNIADVTWADGSKAIYNADWFLMYYDGESRSNQKSNYESHWKVYEGTTLEAGKGYIVGITGHPTKSKVKYELRFPMAQDVLAAEQENKTVAVNAWGVKKDIRPNHKGWNLVGNPYMDYYNTASSYSLGGLPLIEYADTYDPSTGLWDYEERESGSVPFLVIPQDGGWSEYQQELASGVDMQPFTAYFVQVGDPNNEGHSNGMKLDARFETTKRGRSSLIRRAPSEVDEQEELAIVAVELTNAKGESDKTTLLIADRFTNEYEMNADFFKWFGDYYTYYTKPVLYTIGADSESRAFNALNEELAAQPVALGMYAAQTGNYTFSLHQRSNLTGVAEVWLHDASNNTHTNLLQDDYTFSTSKTNGAGRFSLSVKMMPKLPTDVENIKQGKVWATTQDNNIVVNGLTKDMQLWIYDATGKLLHADRTTNYQHSYSVPQTGAYFVRVHDKNDAQTIKVVVE